MKTLNIKPALYRKVRDPITNDVLPEDRTSTVIASSYWLRRLRLGDIVEVNAELSAEAVETEAPRKRGRPKKIKGDE